MTRKIALQIVLVLSTWFALLSSAYGADILVSPKELSPGDAFLIKVTSTEHSAVTISFNDKTIPVASCGESCAFGIGSVHQDAVAKSMPVSVSVNGRSHTAFLRIKKPSFPVTHITLSGRHVDLSAEDLNRAKEEEKRLRDLWLVSSVKLFDSAFALPLNNSVSTVFGAKRIFNNKSVSIHRGVDFRAAKGERVLAANRGRVVLAEDLFFGGNTVILDHGLGIYTIYMHLDSMSVSLDSLVEKGALVGLVGSTGRSSGPHLHFGLKILNQNSNPLSIMALDLK